MVDKIDTKNVQMADEKKKASATAPATATDGAIKVNKNSEDFPGHKKPSEVSSVLKTLDAISQPQSVKRFYIAYLTSDIVLAGLTYAVIIWIRLQFHATWESTWNNLWLFYIIFISILVGRISKAVTDYVRWKIK